MSTPEPFVFEVKTDRVLKRAEAVIDTLQSEAGYAPGDVVENRVMIEVLFVNATAAAAAAMALVDHIVDLTGMSRSAVLTQIHGVTQRMAVSEEVQA